MPLSSTTRHALLLAVALACAAVAIATGLHRGEDIENHLRLAGLLLERENFYQPSPPFGTWWPPAAIGLLTPFALLGRLSWPLAKASYALVGLAFLYWAVARTRLPDWRRTALALAAVTGPVAFDFRYLNISVILLGVVVAGTIDLERGRDTRAGLWFGLAAALKLFPALLLLYLAWRRRWRALAAGAAVALALTIVPLAALGLPLGVETARTWLDLSAAGVPIHRLGNQSLPELMWRLGAPDWVALLLRVLVIALTIRVLRLRQDVRAETALVLLAAVLLSPIAWWYYFVLAYPAWLVVLARLEPRGMPVRTAALAFAAVMMCGILGPRAAGIPIVAAGVFMWGALSLYAVLVGTWGSGVVRVWETPLRPHTPTSPQPQP